MLLLRSHAQDPVAKELYITIPFALMFTHLMLGHQMEGNYLELLLNHSYIIDLACRSALSFLLIILAKMITRYFDVRNPWNREVLVRLFIQLFYGLFLLVLFDFLVTVLYFQLKGMSIYDQPFVTVYFLAINIYVLLINIYYGLPDFVQSRRQDEGALSVTAKQEDQKQTATDIVLYAEQQQVVYISISYKSHFAKNISGEAVFWHYTITESIHALPADQFYQLSRSVIVHRDIIHELIRHPENQSLTVVLKSPFKDKVRIPKGNIPAFKKWWNMATGES